MNYNDIYKKSLLIRNFEKYVEKEFSLGKMRGTTHGCIGQEVIPVAVFNKVTDDDYITGTHRCHGHILAYTENPYKLACEMMGKKDGFNAGMGGSQHIKVGKYITNGVTGGMVSVGVGMAMSLKKRNSNGIIISFLGDGGFNEGYVQESLNLAVIYGLPILFVCENNRYAMSTPTSKYSASEISSRVTALNMKYINSSSDNIPTLFTDIDFGYNFVKKERKPCFINVNTFRLCGHSKSDEMEYMTDDEKKNNIINDPLNKIKANLTSEEVLKIDKEVNQMIEIAFDKASKCPEIGLNEYRMGI